MSSLFGNTPNRLHHSRKIKLKHIVIIKIGINFVNIKRGYDELGVTIYIYNDSFICNLSSTCKVEERKYICDNTIMRDIGKRSK